MKELLMANKQQTLAFRYKGKVGGLRSGLLEQGQMAELMGALLQAHDLATKLMVELAERGETASIFPPSVEGKILMGQFTVAGQRAEELLTKFGIRAEAGEKLS